MSIPVSSLDDAALKDVLRRLSLTFSLEEARSLAERLGRDVTETELTLFDTMWSEHCSYKSSRQVLKQYLPTDAGNVILGPGEDAGIIHLAEIDGVKWALALAHESHNHPSQVMPVEGAATGIGGIVRDVYCMGADVIATLDPLRFGDPTGENGERSLEITREVMEGIAMYGNALGVPNLGGDVVFDSCYDDNCLVNVVAVGLVREDRIIRSRVPDAARIEPYDFILVGKPTDWSGMGGASFASADLDHAAALENRGSVQVADPFLKRMLVVANQAVLEMAQRAKVPIGFKDLGAGGIACVSSEMADAGGFSIDLDLEQANLAEKDLPHRVAACSETQERFGLAVPRRITAKVLEIYNETYQLGSVYEGAGAVVLGRIQIPEQGKAPRYLLRRGEEILVDAPTRLITEGIRYDRPARETGRIPSDRQPDFQDVSVGDCLIRLLSSHHLCSRRALYQHYDSEVKAHTVIRPGEADAGLVAPVDGSSIGVALTVDGNPRYCRIDPYLGAVHAVVESVRNVACVGGIPSAVTDCLNYGNPEMPEVFHAFSEGVRGIGDACRGLGRLDMPGQALPVVSGNVSFYNQSSTGKAIDPSPIICCVGIVADVSRSRSLMLKKEGNPIYHLGAISSEMGGSVLARILDPEWIGPLPPVDYAAVNAEIRTVLEAYAQRWSLACHDISEGGMLVALSEMMLGAESLGKNGVRLDLKGFAEKFDDHAICFSEAGAFLLEIDQEKAEAFEAAAARHGAVLERIGEVTGEGILEVKGLAGGDLRLESAALKKAREGLLPMLLAREAS